MPFRMKFHHIQPHICYGPNLFKLLKKGEATRERDKDESRLAPQRKEIE